MPLSAEWEKPHIPTFGDALLFASIRISLNYLALMFSGKLNLPPIEITVDKYSNNIFNRFQIPISSLVKS